MITAVVAVTLVITASLVVGSALRRALYRARREGRRDVLRWQGRAW